MGPIFFVTGVPGCGKTTVSRALLSHFSKGVHISVDDLREAVVSGFVLPDFAWPPEVDEQFRLARESATDTARRYAAAGFAVVVDDCLGPQREPAIDTGHYGGLVEDPSVVRVLLRPSLEVVLERNRSRGNALADFLAQVIPVLYEVQDRGLRDGWTSIDTSELTVDETVERVLALTVTGA
jgi:broad-specificity NMP kinase